MTLGEMDVARVNPYRSGQNEPPVHMAWFAPHRPATVTEWSSAVALKSKAFTFTSFSFIFLTCHDRKRIATALATRAPFRDFRLDEWITRGLGEGLSKGQKRG